MQNEEREGEMKEMLTYERHVGNPCRGGGLNDSPLHAALTV